MENRQFLNCFVSVGTCLVLSVIYVASLYIWKMEGDSNHPSTIKKRFCSVLIMMFISPTVLYFAISDDVLLRMTLFEVMGFKLQGLLQAFIMPLFLTMILFLGPIATKANNDLSYLYVEPIHWKTNLQNVVWLKTHVVAPLSEEFTFRSCMLPLLLQCFPAIRAVVICPLFFGVAHFHHMIERVNAGYNFKTVLLISCFQFIYTTIFGMYSAYLFLRTGHFVSTFMVHAFCNHMGVPDFQEVFNIKGNRRYVIVGLYFLGLILWYYLLNPLTEPSWYHNKLLHLNTLVTS